MKTEITWEDEDLPEKDDDQFGPVLQIHLSIDLHMMKHGKQAPEDACDEILSVLRDAIFCHYYNRYPPEKTN